MKILKISCREQDNFRYIGWDISQNEDGIEIDQNAYKEVIETVKISNHRRNQPDHELSDYEKKQYQQVLGQLTWITSQSRPDVRFKVLECSLKSNKPTVADLIQINQVVLKLKKTSYNIHLPILSKDPSKYNIMAFSDASVNNLKPDRVESTKASIIFLECDGKVIPLTWSSKKIKRVCKEILLAECIALSKVVFLHMPQTHLECLIFFATDPFWRVEGAHAVRRGPRGAARPTWRGPRGAAHVARPTWRGPRGAARPLPFWSS